MSIQGAVFYSVLAIVGVVSLGVWLMYSIYLGIEISDTYGGSWMLLYIPTVIALNVVASLQVLHMIDYFLDRI